MMSIQKLSTSSELHHSVVEYCTLTHEKKNILISDKGKLKLCCRHLGNFSMASSPASCPMRSHLVGLRIPAAATLSEFPGPILSSGKIPESTDSEVKKPLPKQLSSFELLIRDLSDNYFNDRLEDFAIRESYSKHSKDLMCYKRTSAYSQVKKRADADPYLYGKDLAKFAGSMQRNNLFAIDRKTLVLGLEDVLVTMSMEKVDDYDLVVPVCQSSVLLGEVRS